MGTKADGYTRRVAADQFSEELWASGDVLARERSGVRCRLEHVVNAGHARNKFERLRLSDVRHSVASQKSGSAPEPSTAALFTVALIAGAVSLCIRHNG